MTMREWSAAVVLLQVLAPGASGQGRPPVAECVAGLHSANVTQRAAAVDCVREAGPRALAAIPKLVELLADAERMHWDGAGPGGRMSGGSFCAREAAGAALVAIGEPAVGPLTEALASHPDARVREGAAQVLAGFTDPRVAEALVRALSDEGEVPESGATALGNARKRRVYDAAHQSLVGSASGLGADLLWSRLGSPATATPSTAAAAATPSESRARERMLAVLVARHDARVTRLVSARLRSPAWRTRMSALEQLQAVAPEADGTLATLIAALKDASWRVRARAIEILGRRALAASSGSPERRRITAAIEAARVEAQAEVDRRSRAFQASDDVLQVVYRATEALDGLQGR